VKQTLEETRAKRLAAIADASSYCFDIIFSGARQTHRFSGSDGCAGNPQNFGRESELKAAIGAPLNKSLIVADLNKIEPRILALLSRDSKLMTDVFEKDPYCSFASLIYKKEITKETFPKERRVGKEAVLGLGYGMGWERFIKQLYAKTGITITSDFSKYIVNLYRNTYKEVPRFWKTCEQVLEEISKKVPRYFPGVSVLRLVQNGVVLPSGLIIRYNNLRYTWQRTKRAWRKEWVYDRYKTQKQKLDQTKIYGGMLAENICQALAGEVCKEAIIRLIDYGYKPAGQVHDELLVVCDTDEVERVKYLVAAAMTDPMPWWKQLPLEVEINSGRNWLEAK
jgi:DNA polymerase